MHRRALVLLPVFGLAALTNAASAANTILAVEVSAPGQDAEWIAEEIAVPFERAFGKLLGLVDMKSVSSESSYVVELQFEGVSQARFLEQVNAFALQVRRALRISVSEPVFTFREATLG